MIKMIRQRIMINTTLLRNITSTPPVPIFGQKSSGIGFTQATHSVSTSTQPNNKDMDKGKEEINTSNQETGDVMSSFGEGYSTRCDEEGFGGIYGGKQSLKPQNDPVIDPNHSEYDKTQGSEVKEKEKSRHQTGPNRQ
ncbi:uncharacterized protein LOC115714469 isoform X1 [Cannabis sativa]|uniref:uncharacterized protein LOC115714469 isoform X1 n=1 Tax=Cannabis sativa TaxID=3483 RepID=UPI0029C9C7E9|nr:uncharacterized protein LOC115714469 isoform X1 [Cannabis sativa]